MNFLNTFAQALMTYEKFSVVWLETTSYLTGSPGRFVTVVLCLELKSRRQLVRATTSSACEIHAMIEVGIHKLR